MKQNVLRRLCLLLTVIMIVCPAMIWISGTDVSAAYSMCPMCGGTGHRSITIMQTQTIGYNSVTGMPQTIMVPYTTAAVPDESILIPEVPRRHRHPRRPTHPHPLLMTPSSTAP